MPTRGAAWSQAEIWRGSLALLWLRAVGSISPTPGPGPPARAQWGATVPVCLVPQELHPVRPPAEAPSGAHRGEAPQVPGETFLLSCGLRRSCIPPGRDST